MENLWAPWRMRYIESVEDEKGCIFCDKPEEENDRENLILFRSDFSFIIMNKFPYNNGHLLIVPYRHEADFMNLSDDELKDINRLIKKSYSALGEALRPHGINIGVNLGRVAGAGIENHIHYHIVPRWDGDTNFMPVIGQTKVISQGLEETYDKLFSLLNES